MAGKRILVVEDEIITADDIRENLQDLGYTVLAVSSGEEAIKKIEEASPDLVLMDIMLRKELDGIETAKQIRFRFNIPVVYLTAYSDKKILERAKITEPFGYIIKPFSERELQINIDIALCKHKMERELKESEKWLTAIIKGLGLVSTRILGFIHERAKSNSTNKSQRTQSMAAIIFANFELFAVRILCYPQPVYGH